MFAKEFAKAILCENRDKPCNKCESCISFVHGNNPDITIIDETEKSIKTETIKQMVKDVYEKPIKSMKKIYIINDSEKMTKEAQNSLLKTLEEPPEYIVIILVTSNDNLLLNTIKSRCTIIKFNDLSNSEIEEVLKTKSIDFNESILELANGSAKNALSMVGEEEKFETIKQIFTNIEKINIIDLLNKKDVIFKDKDKIYEILNFLNIALFDRISTNSKYVNCIKIVEEAKDKLKKNCNYDMTIDDLLLKLWEEVNG